MEEKYNEATRNRPDGDRTLDATAVIIHLPMYIKQIKNEDAWHKNDRNAITVYKTDKLRMVLAAFREKAEMKPQTAEGPTSIQLIEGKVKCITEQEDMELRAGHIIAFHSGTDYNIVALEESVFLLTIAM